MKTTSQPPTLAALLGLVLSLQAAPAATYYSDPGVAAANNTPVDASKFDQRLKELEHEINRKFGEFHPVAKLSRLGMRTEGESPKH